MSARTIVNGDNTPITPRADHHPASAASTKDIFRSLSIGVSNLAGSYDALHGQTMQVALLGAEIGDAQDVKQFRQQMKEQDIRYREGVEEIQNIIDQILENEGNGMREQVNREIADQIDALVQEQVARCLQDHIPEDLQLELAKNRQEFEELQLALHNSESRRVNGSLRANRPEEILHTIHMSDGTISSRFPKDLKGLFDLDVDTVKLLLGDYGITAGAGDTRDASLNKFMQFCGVRYQLVVKPDAHKYNTKPV